MSRQFLQENTLGNSVNGFTKVQLTTLTALHSSTHYVGPLDIEGDQVRQAGPALHKAMLAGPHHLVGLYVPYEGDQDD